MSLADYSLKELGYVVEMLRLGSVREVARRHDAEAGNLSKLLRQTEASLGVSLATRSTTGLSLTEEGRHLLQRLSPIVGQVAELQTSGESFVTRTMLNIGAVPMLMNHVVVPALAGSALVQDEAIHMRLLDVMPDDLQAAALKGACDLCLHISPYDWPKAWHSEDVGCMVWRLYRRRSRKATKGRAGALERYVYPIYWSRDGVNYGNDMHPVPLVRRKLGIGVSSAEAAVRLICQSDLLAFLPEAVAAGYQQQGLIEAVDGTRDDTMVVEQKLRISVRAGKVSSRLYKDILGLIRRQLSEET